MRADGGKTQPDGLTKAIPRNVRHARMDMAQTFLDFMSKIGRQRLF
jgi:hypothetical protein